MAPNLSAAASRRRLFLSLLLGVGALVVTLSVSEGSFATDGTALTALEPPTCGPGSRPETDIDGRVPSADYASGRAAQGYSCNTQLVGRHGTTGGLKVHSYRDTAGHVCAFYDVSLMFPTDVYKAGLQGAGTAVLDMADPAHPVQTEMLRSPAMLSPHESLALNEERGLLVAVMGNAATYPGMLDVYDVTKDCRHPQLMSSTPTGFLGHESGFAPDGRTFYASSLLADTITAIDLTNPRLPRTLTTFTAGWSHGVRTSPDGNLLYVADMGYPDSSRFTTGALKIYDVSAIQQRRLLPQATLLSTFTWRDVAIPQVPEPMWINGHNYLLMNDEFTALASNAAFQYRASSSPAIARIINVDDPKKPFQVSTMRLQVHLEKNRDGDQQNDPGAQSPIGGYASHYCAIPRYRNPELAGCAYIESGLRLFDIRDPHHPKEVGYYNQPAPSGGYAMAKPAFDVLRHQIWFTDVSNGFFAVNVTNGVWPKGL
jgi:hypothetical protein